jgi:hypothetical protein
MPNYEDDALECGWEKTGQKWTHRKYPGETYRSAYDVKDHPSLDRVRRPTSATPPEPPKPVEPGVALTSAEIGRRYVGGESLEEIAEVYGVPRGEITNIVKEAKAKRGRPPKAVENKS